MAKKELAPKAPVDMQKLPATPWERVTALEDDVQAEYYFKQRMVGIGKSTLFLHWELGAFTGLLMEDPDKYGKNSVESFAAKFNQPKEVFHRYHRFHKRVDEKLLLQLGDAHVPPRTVAAIIGAYDDAFMMKLFEKALTGDLTSDEARAAVKEDNKKQQEDRVDKGGKKGRGGSSPKRVFKSVLSDANEMHVKLQDFKVAVKDFDELEDGKAKSETAVLLRDLYRTLEKLHKALEGSMNLRE